MLGVIAPTVDEAKMELDAGVIGELRDAAEIDEAVLASRVGRGGRGGATEGGGGGGKLGGVGNALVSSAPLLFFELE